MTTCDTWRLLTRCPVCWGWVHLARDVLRGTRVAAHPDSVGERCPMSRRLAPDWDEETTRPAVHGRSMGVCEFCREHPATDMHHRMSRGVGGKWHPANIVHLCRGCHARCTDHPQDGHDVGLVVWSYEDPAVFPVLTPFGDLWLTDDVTPPQRRRTSRAHRAGPGRRHGA